MTQVNAIKTDVVIPTGRAIWALMGTTGRPVECFVVRQASVWELRITFADETMLCERFESNDEARSRAQALRARLLDKGWQA